MLIIHTLIYTLTYYIKINTNKSNPSISTARASGLRRCKEVQSRNNGDNNSNNNSLNNSDNNSLNNSLNNSNNNSNNNSINLLNNPNINQ